MRTKLPMDRDTVLLKDLKEGDVFYYPYARDHSMFGKVRWFCAKGVFCEVIHDTAGDRAGKLTLMPRLTNVYQFQPMEVVAWVSK